MRDIQNSEVSRTSKDEQAFYRQIFLLAGLVAFLRGAMIVALSVRTQLMWSDVLGGHDGVEYLAIANSVIKGSFRELPVDVWRHDVGWPLVISVLGFVMPTPLAALVWILFFSAVTVSLVAHFARQHFGSTNEEALRLGATVALGYPAAVYYSCFALSEPLVLCTVVAAFYVAGLRRWGAAGFLAGAAASGRASAIFLLPALALACVLQQGRFQDKGRQCAWLVSTALIPFLGITLWRQTAVGVQPLSLHQPHFSFPFAAFQDFLTRGWVRGIYLLVCTIAACFGAVKMLFESVRRHNDPLLHAAASFTLMFLLFHVCLESLTYYGSRLLLADYFDRYLVAIWPFIVFATRRWWKWPFIALCFSLSVVATLYWGENYFRQVREKGAPMLEHLARPETKR
ncbi:MAG: hypothetical protein N2Z21_05745 [Candidatus Sumerlaeaceae bacterium]|nr:hypothetical protein [Candidatus Sumerlaeaceae bacterium]